MTEKCDILIYEEGPETKHLESQCRMKPRDFEELSMIASNFIIVAGQARMLKIAVEIDTPEFKRVWAFLKDRGYKSIPYGPVYRALESNEFMYRIDRTFNEAELHAAEYLNVSLSRALDHEAYRTPKDNLLVVPEASLKNTKLGYVVLDQWFVVSAELKSELSNLNMKLDFSPLCAVEKPAKAISGFYELTSRIKTPPLQGLQIMDENEVPFDGNTAKSWMVFDGFYRVPQLAFSKAEFEKLPAFDLAFTQEVCKTVCSNRLYKFLKKYDKKISAVPIKLI